ncbi:MAG: SHOCT domain-containing protein [Actinomycetes bacterium]
MASDFGTFIIQLLWIWLIIMFIFIWFMVIMDLFSDHTMGGFAKAIWIIFLIIVPPIATLIYLIARGKSMQERRIASAKAANEAQKAYIQSAVGSVSPADQIASAKSLLDAGTISQQEFDSLKAKALA